VTKTRRGVYDPPAIPWWQRKWTPPDPKPLPSVPVDDSAIPAVHTSPALDNRLRDVQRRFDEAAEQQFRDRQPVQRPPPGKIRILATDVDKQGRTWITKFINSYGNIETKKIGSWLYGNKLK
jgi:hypothetical protein